MKQIAVATLTMGLWVVSVSQGSGPPRAGVVKKQSRTSAQLATNSGNNQETAEDAMLNAILAAITKNEQERTADLQQETTDENKAIKAEWWLVYVGIAQAFALICTLVVIGIQTKKTSEATQTMRDSLPIQKSSADAALLNAQAIINSERAWFLFEDMAPIEMRYAPSEIPQKTKVLAFVPFKNFGRTVGKLTAYQFGLYIISPNIVPDSSVFNISETCTPIIIPQGDPLPQVAELKNNGGVMGQDDWDAVLRDKTKSLWLCGILKYEDIFKPGVEHETKICRQYGRWISPKAEPFFKSDGLPEYNTQT
jgi:hypothetical protein